VASASLVWMREEPLKQRTVSTLKDCVADPKKYGTRIRMYYIELLLTGFCSS
jgi:hypothetical protein